MKSKYKVLDYYELPKKRNIRNNINHYKQGIIRNYIYMYNYLPIKEAIRYAFVDLQNLNFTLDDFINYAPKNRVLICSKSSINECYIVYSVDSSEATKELKDCKTIRSKRKGIEYFIVTYYEIIEGIKKRRYKGNLLFTLFSESLPFVYSSGLNKE